MAPIDLKAMHAEADPPGYVIEHIEDGGEVVAVRLVRLHDRKVIGRYKTRAGVDRAVQRDPSTP